MNRSVPVVLVHGIRLSGACWQQQRRLLPGRTVVAPDLPGHGRRRGEEFTIDAAVDTVTQAIEEVGGRAVVVGHSLGGYVGIATAARRPDRVAALVGFGCTLPLSRPLLRGFAWGSEALAKAPVTAPWSMPQVLRRSLPTEIVEPILDAGIAYEVTPSVMRALATFDPIAELRRHPGRTALVNGGHDHFRLGERGFAAACRNGRLHLVPGAGHYLPLTYGAESARLIEDAAALADIDHVENDTAWETRLS